MGKNHEASRANRRVKNLRRRTNDGVLSISYTIGGLPIDRSISSVRRRNGDRPTLSVEKDDNQVRRSD